METFFIRSTQIIFGPFNNIGFPLAIPGPVFVKQSLNLPAINVLS